jgi:hypothetical protein
MCRLAPPLDGTGYSLSRKLRNARLTDDRRR